MSDEADPKPPAEEAPAPALAAPPAPPNKLHEWAAAAAIMVLLGGILYVFLSFLRGARL